MTTTVSAWRAAADPDELREYDRFGPWIEEVREFADLPKRFRPWWRTIETARTVLKIPRDYDRDQIRPGMDLYRALVVVYPDVLTVLAADGPEVLRRDLPIGHVVGSLRHTRLLDAHWTLLLVDGGQLSLPYNSVSAAVIADVEATLLDSAAGGPTAEALPDPVRPRDHLFRTLVLELNAVRDDILVPLHVEDEGHPCRSERGRRRRTAGMMVLASARELVVVNRGVAVHPLVRRSANYACAVTTIPYRGITGAEFVAPEPSDPPRLGELRIACGQQVVTQPCLDRPDAVLGLLAGQEIPTR